MELRLLILGQKAMSPRSFTPDLDKQPVVTGVQRDRHALADERARHPSLRLNMRDSRQVPADPVDARAVAASPLVARRLVAALT